MCAMKSFKIIPGAQSHIDRGAIYLNDDVMVEKILKLYLWCGYFSF